MSLLPTLPILPTSRRLCGALSLGLLAAASLVLPVQAQADNCNAPSRYATPPQTVEFDDDDFPAVLVGNPNCRVYLYNLASNGNLVKSSSYGLVGDVVRLRGVIYLFDGSDYETFVRVYFPGSNTFGWLPATAVAVVD